MTRLFMPGDRVKVCSPEKIMATLDSDGSLEGLPFMPEMIPLCGQEFKVSCRIEQTCAESAGGSIRRLANVIALEGLRCDGSAHDRCDRCCLLLWKEQWLKPADGSSTSSVSSEGAMKLLGALRTRIDAKRYFCQSTRLLAATSPYPKWDFRRFYLGATYRGAGAKGLLQFALLPFLHKFKRLVWGRLTGKLRRTPSVSLNFKPGDVVEVKSADEIKATLDVRGRNRGLSFERQMLPFCGRCFVVKQRVARMIDEETGVMKELKDTVLLENVTCDGHTRLGGCPREVYHFWREAWLKPASARSTRKPLCEYM